jgi:hypothetical protein
MPYIDVRFHFDEITEGDSTYYNLKYVQHMATDIPEDSMLDIAETLGQGDHWNVGGVGATLDAMTDPTCGRKDVRDYW